MIDPDLPVIMVSSDADVQIAQATLAHGAFDYVSKPFDVVVLERAVEAAVAQRDQRGPDR